jgi:hypothetical protein
MRTIARRPGMGALCHLALLLGLSTAAAAQTYYGIAGGLSYAGPADLLGTGGQGFAAQASLGRELSSRFAMRVDALTSQFAFQQRQIAGYLCAYRSPCGPPPVVNTVGVVGLVASGVATVDPPESPVLMYLIAGAGTYYCYDHPSAAGVVRMGVSAGAGFSVHVGPPRLFVEGRYHDLFRAPSQPTWLVPVVFGIRF